MTSAVYTIFTGQLTYLLNAYRVNTQCEYRRQRINWTNDFIKMTALNYWHEYPRPLWCYVNTVIITSSSSLLLYLLSVGVLWKSPNDLEDFLQRIVHSTQWRRYHITDVWT